MTKIHTMLCPNRLNAIRCAMALTNKLCGDIAEFGVYAGATAKVMFEMKGAGRTLHLFDSWDGCPEHNPALDTGNVQRGGCKCTYEDFIKSFGDHARSAFVDINRGWFEKTIGAISKPLAFVHLDCDMHDGTKLVLNHVLPLMVQGGLIIVDDYHLKFKGVMKAVDENTAGWNKLVIAGKPHDSVLLWRA